MTHAYPPAPWRMRGQLWLSLFRVPAPVDAEHPRGVYGLALVDYEPGSPLTYHELLVARPVREQGRAVTITEIWVDSAASMAGGRELWAIPKDLCDFTTATTGGGLVRRTTWSATQAGRPIVSARFTDVSRAGVRLPFKGATWQPQLADGVGAGGGDRTARLTGSAKTLPCRASWDLDPHGPLGWLAGRRPLASFRMCDFRMSFG